MSIKINGCFIKFKTCPDKITDKKTAQRLSLLQEQRDIILSLLRVNDEIWNCPKNYDLDIIEMENFYNSSLTHLNLLWKKIKTEFDIVKLPDQLQLKLSLKEKKQICDDYESEDESDSEDESFKENVENSIMVNNSNFTVINYNFDKNDIPMFNKSNLFIKFMTSKPELDPDDLDKMLTAKLIEIPIYSLINKPLHLLHFLVYTKEHNV